jgi:hypothetical protein
MTRSRDVADTQDNIGGPVPPFAAGKNKIINGDMGVWQRGTSFSITANLTYTADRFLVAYSTAAPTSWTISQQTFTPGTAPVAGYEGQYFFRSQVTTIGTATSPSMRQRIEDVRTFAGQSVTVSFWAKADTARTVTSALTQVFGSGGSSAVTALDGGSLSLTTSWTRYSYTGSIPSISGKTIGTGSYLQFAITLPTADATIDIWGVQVEAGSVATAFQTATGTIQGELAACQRYYWRFTGGNGNFAAYGTGVTGSTTQCDVFVQFPTTMRTRPTTLEFSTLALADGLNTASVSTLTVLRSNEMGATLAAGATGLIQYRPHQLLNNSNSTTAFLGVTAEL